MKIGLGTAQFGLNYGISNKSGKTAINMVANILALAAANGIKIIDTSPVYGASEEILGQKLNGFNHKFNIITKIPKLEMAKGSARHHFFHSLSALKQTEIYGVLFHHPDDLLQPGGEFIYNELISLKANGLLNKVGISVYTEQQTDMLLDTFKFDFIQLPINVFDQRFILKGYLKHFKELNMEVHARSVFLQGLLLMPRKEIPLYFSPILPTIIKYHDFITSENLSLLKAALGFALGIKEIDAIICGVNSDSQLLEILENQGSLPADLFTQFSLDDLNYLNPSMWKV